eukprot:1058531-Rhodomonas_salina.1
MPAPGLLHRRRYCTNDGTLLEKSGDLHHPALPRLVEMMASTHNNKVGGHQQRMSGPGGLRQCKEATFGMLEWGAAGKRRVGPDLLQHVPELSLG